MRLIEDFIPDGAKCDTRMLFGCGQPRSITLHWTGPFPGQSPAQVRRWWIDSGGEASAHFIVKDDEVLQCWPLERIAWHAGCVAGNATSIGIEVIPADTDGRFSEKSCETLRELLATLPHYPIVRHYDWTRKQCPAYYVDDARWGELLSRIRKA